MRDRPGPPPNDSINGGTLVLAGLIILGMMGAGYFFFVRPDAATQAPQTDAVPVQRVVPLTPEQVVQRASDEASVAVFAARIAAEKGESEPAASKKGTSKKSTKGGLVIEEVGSRGRSSGKTPSFQNNPLLDKIGEVDKEMNETQRLRRLRSKMMREEHEAALREAKEKE